MITPAEAESHVVARSEPAIPKLALTTGIGGTVRLRVVIAPSGDVSSVKVISGHPFFIKSAIEAVNKRKYRPFVEDGKPIAVEAEVDLYFPNRKDLETHDRFVAAGKKCRSLVLANKFKEADKKCSEAVRISNELPDNAILERSQARALLAHAMFVQHRYQEAVPLYEEALKLDKGYLKSNDADLATDYANLGRAYAASGDRAGADGLFATSVSTFQAAIENLPQMKQNYTERLKRTLAEYAQLKEAAGQGEAAQELRNKAAGL